MDHVVTVCTLIHTDGLQPQWDVSYKVIGVKKLSPEEMRRYENIYDPSYGRSEEQKARAIQEVLLGMSYR